jgi:hypothetical protein
MTQESTPDRAAERTVGRRNLLKGAAAVGLGTISGRGIYETLGDIVRPTPAQAATVVRRMQEQYLIRQLEVIIDNGQTVVIPPIFNDVFTAKLSSRVTWTAAALKNAKTRVENALAKVEAPYPDTAAGLTIVVGWGLPYFQLSAAMQALGNKYLPAVPNTGRQQLAVINAIRFPSDPGYDPNDGHTPVALEDNHVMFKFRSDSQTILRTVESQLFENASSGAYIGDLFDLTSKRMGFAGRGFGVLSQGKTLAAKAGLPAAGSIPDRAQLMMGFTSTQTQALGPDNIVSFETLKGATDQWPAGYFAAGCAMHLSHLYLDLDDWYGSARTYAQRVQQMFSPRAAANAPAGALTIPNGPKDVATLDEVKADDANQLSGHNSLLQQATRLGSDTVDNYGRLRTKGTAIPIREDFNTLDDPFAWLPGDTVLRAGTRPGLHFVAFVPSHLAFHKARMAMDGHLPTGDVLTMSGRSAGINSIITTTHRQNYVIPPRKNRSFPLAELLT